MLNRTLLSIIAVAVFALLLVGTASTSAADEKRFSVDFGKAVVLGQNQGASRNNLDLGRWFRQTIDRILPDEGADRRDQRPPPPVTPSATQVQPPRPITNEEIRQSQPAAAPGQRTGTATNAGPFSQSRTDERGDESIQSTARRMQEFRSTVFPPQARATLEAATQHSQPLPGTPPSVTVPLPSIESSIEVAEHPRGFANDSSIFPQHPAESRTPVVTHVFPIVPEPQGAAPQHSVAQRMMPFHSELPLTNLNVPSEFLDPFASSQRASPHLVAPQGIALEGERQRLVSANPSLQLEIVTPPGVIVGQEAIYRFHITNTSSVPAERVVVEAEIPSWISIRHRDASDGRVIEHRREDGSGTTDLSWRVNRVNPGVTETFVLALVPQQHQAINFPVRYDFHRPAIVMQVDVREPRLEMELIGADEVLWNEMIIYKLLVRNVGNGDAENLRLDLLQTSAGDSEAVFAEPLRPGEVQELDIKVQAGREREHIDITVVATGSHDVRAEVQRRIRVLRPRLEMSVQTLPLHFVENPAEFTIRVRNVGTADAENLTIRAELPLGMQYTTSSDGGFFVTQQQQNIVEWRGKNIPRGEMRTFTLVCEPRREGNSRVSVEVIDPSVENIPSGSNVLVAGNATFTAEAIVDLSLVVNAPRGPIELGQNVEYEIRVTNIGTRSAENVEILLMLGPQLNPVGVDGGAAGVTDDGQVIFEMIPTILPKQTVAVKVIVEATGVGTVPIRAEVVRSDVSGIPVSLQQGLSAHIFSRTATDQPRNEVF